MSEPWVTWEGRVLPEWTDYNGHLRDAYYLLVFSYGTDGFMDSIGLDADGREASGHSLFTLECHLNFLHEVKRDEPVQVHTQLLAHDQKRVWLYHSLHRPADPETLAASEQVLLHVALEGPRSAPFGTKALKQLAMMKHQQPSLSPARYIGRVITAPGLTNHG
ncbi:thioesterase family protein [Pseudomonas japonica]|uniref:thioesterase family protein n=1 Tax=Pseudomonas japonica TaxID=256466 RepID=UPI0015E42AF3|nr:thioesterase family protein [Pseudomonas japonica]MBA1243028.1 thioesterase [Pseudomonas japonica]